MKDPVTFAASSGLNISKPNPPQLTTINPPSAPSNPSPLPCPSRSATPAPPSCAPTAINASSSTSISPLCQAYGSPFQKPPNVVRVVVDFSVIKINTQRFSISFYSIQPYNIFNHDDNLYILQRFTSSIESILQKFDRGDDEIFVDIYENENFTSKEKKARFVIYLPRDEQNEDINISNKNR